MSEVVYNVEKLKKLWNQGRTHAQIASALGCPVLYVSQLRERHKLPKRRRSYYRPSIVDPTPDELERLKQELREKHFAEMRALG
jgi:hypothetical protein